MERVNDLNIPEDYPIFVAHQLESFLEPLAAGATDKAREELWKTIVEVCRLAFKCRMKMRMSKEGYLCESLGSYGVPPFSTMEHFAESYGVEGGKTEDRSDEVSYVLFGALTKVALSGEANILEKAQVILKRK